MKTGIIAIILCTIQGFAFAQSSRVSEDMRLLFEGRWIQRIKNHSNTIEIEFPQDKDYALFKDIGTGEAPTTELQAQVKGNMLVIPARCHVNDYIEMEVINNQLVLRIQPVTCEEVGLPPDRSHLISRRFQKLKRR